jgi:hypothetical protein
MIISIMFCEAVVNGLGCNLIVFYLRGVAHALRYPAVTVCEGLRLAQLTQSRVSTRLHLNKVKTHAGLSHSNRRKQLLSRQLVRNPHQ